MGEWRYYAQRLTSGLWLDTNVQLADVVPSWSLSAPNAGQALVPAGLAPAAREVIEMVPQLRRKNLVPHAQPGPGKIAGWTGMATSLVAAPWDSSRNAVRSVGSGSGIPFIFSDGAAEAIAANTTVYAYCKVQVPAGMPYSVSLHSRTPNTYFPLTYNKVGTGGMVEHSFSAVIPTAQAVDNLDVALVINNSTNGLTSYLGDVVISKDGPVTSYFDGSSSKANYLYQWTGAVNDSISTESELIAIPRQGEPLTMHVAEDGRPVWGKMDTLLLAEEDGNLAWAGVCTGANPTDKGVHIEFTSPFGTLQRVDYSGYYAVWKTNVFDVVRSLINHAYTKPDYPIRFKVPTTDSLFTVGDTQPPAKPQPPARKKGESVAQWKASTRYKAYETALKSWNDKYKDRKRYEIGWYESPYIGEEIDTLAKESGFDYREGVRWVDKANLRYEFELEFADNLAKRRDDIAFVDGVNLAKALDPKDGNDKFANRVIGLGAGEGRSMARVTVGGSDGRLYQAEFVQYKSIANGTRLRNLAEADYKVLNNKSPKIDSLTVWDVEGFAGVSTLRVGDEVKVTSANTVPAVDAWVRVKQITRSTEESVAIVTVETIG